MNKLTIFKIAFFISVYGVFVPPLKAEVNSFSAKIVPKEISSFETFKRLAILDEGRIKPLDTYSRNILLRFSGKKTFEKQPAIRWLARLLFAPEATRDDSIFLINHPDLPMALGIEPEEKRRYSYRQIKPQLEKLQELAQKARTIDAKSRSIVENELIRLEENVDLYKKLADSLLFILPHPDFTPEKINVVRMLNLPGNQNQFSFLDIALRAEALRDLTEPLEQKAQVNWSKSELEIIRILTHLYQWASEHTNLPLQIVPDYESGTEIWLSPWDALAPGLQSETGRREIERLKDMTVSYWNGEQVKFDIAARAYTDSIRSRSEKKIQKALKRIPTELLYNQLNLFRWAKIFYLFAFLLFLLSLFFSKKFLYQSSLLLTGLGFLAHTTALAMRISILTRPPVTNLYETFIFVGFIAVLVGLILEKVNRNWLGVMIAGLSGLIFLTIAEKFSAEGDTLKMLVAVLNSNFWLGTHVLTITTGYAGVCVAGILGHVYILQGLFKSKDQKLLENTYRNILGVLGFGLTMTFLGTNLGGIWADQSWGRFWGWDPKENGAMLIVLWCAIIFHAKVGRLIGPLGVAVGCILGIIVVVWAWFGVNFLSVGLHSYGFTSGAAYGLLSYVIFQLLFVTLTVPLFKKRVSFK